MIEKIIVVLIVSAVAAITAFCFVRRLSGKAGGCGCGKSICTKPNANDRRENACEKDCSKGSKTCCPKDT